MSTDRVCPCPSRMQPVMEVVLVGFGQVGTPAGPADDGEGGVEHGDARG